MNLPDLALIAIIIFIIVGTVFASYKLSKLRASFKEATKKMTKELKQVK